MSDWFPPTEPDYGDDCNHCYAPGLTPSTFAVSFSEIERGGLWVPADGQPPNGTFFVRQNPGVPCLWEWGDVAFPYLGYFLEAGQSTLVYYPNATSIAFEDTPQIACVTFFESSFIHCPTKHFCHGVATVMTAWEAQGWIEDVTPIVDPDPLFKIVSMPNDRAVISYIDRWGDTKIKMLIDRSP